MKQYFERDDDTAVMAVQVDSYMTGVVVLDEEKDDGEDLDDANVLELWPLPSKESYTDVNISENLAYQQREHIQELVQEYGDKIRNNTGGTTSY